MRVFASWFFSILAAVMFSSAARAFSVVSRSHASLVRPASSSWRTTTLVPRFLSTDTPDTSVVATCQEKIQKALEADTVKVVGAYDDPNGSHISIEVVSSKFEGKRPVQRQQLVYKAIWEELQGPVHACDSMICLTPEEASSK